jgi:PAS domain S-box-containing protein
MSRFDKLAKVAAAYMRRLQHAVGGFQPPHWILRKGAPRRSEADLAEDTRRAEEAPPARELDFRLIVDSIPAPVAIMTSAGDVELVNRLVLEYFGKTLEELKGWAMSDAVHPDDLPHVVAVWREAVETGHPYEVESRHRRADGVHRWFHVRGFPLRDAEGRIVRWCVLLTDVDDRKTADEALRNSEPRYWHLFDRMPIAMWQFDVRRVVELFEGLRAAGVTDLGAYLDRHPEFLYRLMDALIAEDVNEHAFKMFGARDRSELLGPCGFLWERSPDTFRRSVESRFHGEAMFQEETKFITRDGREIDALFATAESGKEEIVGALMDTTEARRSQEALHAAQTALAHAGRVATLGEVTATIAHEVNQPLAAIITNSESSLRWLARPEPNVEKVRELTKHVVADARRASEIVGRIRAMATRRAPERARVSLDDVIKESMVFLRHEFQSRGVSVSLDLAPELPQVVGDHTQLQQVVVNLVINAVQAMAQSGEIRRSISVRAVRSAPETVCCTIEDSGPGIDSAHLPHLFDSFFTTKDTGIGMGLAISRSIVEAHDGHIRADNNSALGGARFSFALPTDI